MPVEIASNDEQPGWIAVISTINTAGVETFADYSTGYSFTCVVTSTAGATLLTKTTGITGATGGVVTVAFLGAELLAAGVTATFSALGVYRLFLTPRRTSDSADGPTVEDTLVVRYRP